MAFGCPTIANARGKTTKDFIKNNQIKDEQRVVLRDLDRIVGRWTGYFYKLLNLERITGLSLRMECQMMVSHKEYAGMR